MAGRVYLDNLRLHALGGGGGVLGQVGEHVEGVGAHQLPHQRQGQRSVTVTQVLT